MSRLNLPNSDPRVSRQASGIPGMGDRIHALDWSRTPVGAMEQWPRSLKATIKTLLGSRYPMILLWGESLIQIYNDGYTSLIGDKHPWALGRSIRETQAESWDTIGPMIHEVMSSGDPNWVPAQMLAVNRAGFNEETYFSLSYSAVEDDDNVIKGMLCVCSEVTDQVIGERRLRLQRDLASKAAETRNMDEACKDIAATIGEYHLDIPFVLFYLFEADGSLRLCSSVGVNPAHNACINRVSVDVNASDPWSLRQALKGEPSLINGIKNILPVTGGPWDEAVDSALSLPIPGAVQSSPLGVLVAGVSPNSALNESYKSFYQLVTAQISMAFRNALAYEEEKKRVEALAAIDRAKTDFFSNVSHEFRTPLTLMLGPLEDIISGSNHLTENDREQLKMVFQNAVRLLKLVNSLLDFSVIEANRAKATYAATDICALTLELASSFESAIEKAGLRYEISCTPLAEPVYVDPEMWEKIVLNLLSNALKFTLEGLISLELKESDTHAILSVQDTGIGIPPEEIPNIFKRFHRIRNTRSRSHEGTGIGLALVKELVKFHHGSVEVTSLPDSGTTFTVSIPKGTAHLDTGRIGPPRAEARRRGEKETFVNEAGLWAEADVDHPAPEKEEIPKESFLMGEAVVILVVDDNPQMLRYLKRILSTRWKVEGVSDGIEAMEFLRHHKCHLVLSDVMMPSMNGFELLLEMRKDDELKQIPVILLSARAGQESTIEGLEKGANDYLVKPFSARELVARVSVQLEIQRTRLDNVRLRNAEAELKKFKIISDYAFDAFILMKEDGSFAYLNDLAVKRWGYSREEVKSLRVPDVDPIYHEQKFKQVFALAQQQEIPAFETIHKRKDGATFPVEVSMGGITLDGVPHLFAVARDITESKKAQLALRESENKFKTLAESTPEKVWASDREGMLTYWNQNMQKYTGLPAEEHRYWVRFTHPDDLGVSRRVWAIANSKIELYEVECRFRRHDGTYRWHLTRAVPELDEEGKVRLWIGTCTDIHNQKVFTEELEKKVQERTLDLKRINDELQQFAYVASHDLQEPLRKIRTFAELLATNVRNENEIVFNCLHKILSSSERMTTLIRDLLDFSKLADQNARYEMVDLNSVFRDVQGDLELLISQTQANVTCGSLPVIEAIPLQMTQLFYNLISNGLKFRVAGRKPCIEIAGRPLSEEEINSFPALNADKKHYAIEFRDNGIGFKQDYAEQIFTIFQRLHRSSNYSGTGIGLALCKKIVLNHHGEIFAVSEENKGAVFTVVLPEKRS